MEQQQCRHERAVSHQYIEEDAPRRICVDCGKIDPQQHSPIISPYAMGQMLAQALGLENVKGIVRLAVVAEGGKLPHVEVTRMMTEHEAGVYCALLREWKCEILPGSCHETRVSAADAAAVRAGQPSETSHPARG